MKRVGIPCTIEQRELFLAPIAWPLRCACCGSEQLGEPFHFEHRARYSSSSSVSGTVSTYFPLKFDVPYCDACRDHAKQVANLPVLFFVVGLFVVIGLGIAFSDDLLPMLGYMAGVIILGVVLYQIILRSVVYPKMTGACTTHGYAIEASDSKDCVYFHFYNEEYAQLFAQVNGKETEDWKKPNFWSLKRA